MQLIRKRLKVEFWLDDQLRALYNIKVDLKCNINFENLSIFIG